MSDNTPPLTKIGAPQDNSHSKGIAIFALGFRPFFLCAYITAIVFTLNWQLSHVTSINLSTYYGDIAWHSHEMIFGYLTAAIAGFLLTSVRNWTGMDTVKGMPLVWLTALWLGGRILPYFDGTIPHWIISAVDIAFLPILTVAFTIPLIKTKQVHNYAFPAITITLMIANILIHLELLDILNNVSHHGINIAINAIVILLAIVAGRVIPFFIGRSSWGAHTKKWPTIERLSYITIITLVLVRIIFPETELILFLALLTAVIHSIRMAGWYARVIWSDSLLWILYIGYGWIVVSFILDALSVVVPSISSYIVLHAFTTGAISMITLGMMARISLGHTGRPVQSTPLITISFVLITLSGIIRVALPILLPEWIYYFIVLSGSLWAIAFLIFITIYTPILIRPRVDGLAG
jgi:uncharacterized protein involved in response to NO